MCDRCQQFIPREVVRHSCEPCDVDLCTKCFSQVQGSSLSYVDVPKSLLVGTEVSFRANLAGEAPTCLSTDRPLPKGLEMQKVDSGANDGQQVPIGNIRGCIQEAGQHDIKVIARSRFMTWCAKLSFFVGHPPSKIQYPTVPERVAAGVEVLWEPEVSEPPPDAFVSAGTMPRGLELQQRKGANLAAGAIHGRPTRPGMHLIEVLARNKFGSSSTRVSFEVGWAPMRLQYPDVPECFVVNEEFRWHPKVSGGDTEAWSLNGDLPKGIKFQTKDTNDSGEVDPPWGTLYGSVTDVVDTTVEVVASNPFGKSSVVVRIRSALNIEEADEAEVMIEEVEEEKEGKEKKKDEEYLPTEENYLHRQLRTMRILPKDDLPVVYKDDPDRTEKEKKARKDAEAAKNKAPARVPVKAAGMKPNAKPKVAAKKKEDVVKLNLLKAGDRPLIPGSEYTPTEVKRHLDEVLGEYDQDCDEHLLFDEAQRLIWDKEDEQLSPDEFNLICIASGCDPEFGWDVELLLVYLTFIRIDLNENGFLNYDEIDKWQVATGGVSPPHTDYLTLCKSMGADPARGITLEMFVKIQATPRSQRPGGLLGKPNKVSVLARNR